MGVVKVETFSVDAANGTTHALTNDVGALTDAFIRRPGPSDKSSGGPTGSTGNTNPDDAHMGVELTATNQLTFRAGSTVVRKIMGEVWRYTGPAAGLDEFIKRGSFAVTVTAGTGSVAVPGIVDRNDCVPFITGVSTTSGSVNDYDINTFNAHIDASGNLVVNGANGATGMTVYVDVVEFTGSNWVIGHGVNSAHDTADPTVTLNRDSTGAGGAAFNAPASQTFLEISMAGDNGGETGLSDVLITAIQTSNTQVQLRLHADGDGNARNDNTAYIHAISNASMAVFHDSITNISETNGGTPNTVSFPSGAPGDRLLEELALSWMVDTTGVGTAHARGRLNARITVATGTIEHWVHRSGNDVDVQYAVIDLTNVTGFPPVTITSAPTQLDLGDTDQIIQGTNFESPQGAGQVVISDTPAIGTGTDVVQSIDSWTDTQIQFDVDLTGLSDGTVYIIVQNDTGGSAVWQANKGVPGYTDVVSALNRLPDHFHTFNNTYADLFGGLAANSQATAGTVGFFADPLVRGRTHSWGPTGNSSRVEMSDSSFTNVTNTHRRRFIGGFFKFPEIPLDPKGIWEEGGNVNNIYMVIGFGGKLLCNVADSSNGFKLQAFSDFLLTPNRVYHIALLFDGDLGCRCYIDGVLQTGFDGAAPNSNQATHSGDWAYGAPDGSLDTGGTDILFPSFSGARYSDWGTWSNTGNDVPTANDIRVELVEKGAISAVEIASDTPANMQAALDALSGNNYADEQLAIRINKPTGGGDLSLDFDNITFGDRTSIQVQWMGGNGDTLTITNLNGSNVIASKVSTAYGGSATVVNPAALTLTGLENDTEIRVYEAGTTNEIAGQESVTTGTFTTSVQISAVDISIASLGWQNIKLKNIDTSSDVSLPIQQRIDRQYENPVNLIITPEPVETVDSSGFVDNLSDTINVAGDNTLVMVSIAGRQLQDITSMTVGGNAMVLVDEQFSQGSGGVRTYAYRGLAAGSYTVQMNASGFHLWTMVTTSFQNVHQTDAFTTQKQALFGGTNALDFGSSQVYLYSIIHAQNTRTFSPSVGTEVYDMDHPDASLGTTALAYAEDESGITWTVTGDDNTWHLLISIPEV